ncbi:MAG: hypothetical protein ACPGJV_12205 [Bacteriovoracaceae bacterium]
MRALILFLITLSAPFIQSANAEPMSVGVSSTQSSGSGSTAVGAESSSISSFTQSFSFNSGLIENFARVRGSFDIVDRDVNDYIIRDRTGAERRLSESFDGKENNLSLGIDFQKKNFSLSIDSGQTLSDSPLESKSTKVALGYSSYNRGLSLKYTYFTQKANKPLSYVTNPETRRPVALETQLKRKNHEFQYDQIITEYLKSKFKLMFVESNGERPKSYGGRFETLFGITDELGLITGFERIEESEDFLPLNGSGFYTLDSYLIGLGLEVHYTYLLKVLISTTIEEESARGTIDQQQIGTDSIALGFDGRFKRLLPSVLLTYEETNTDLKNFLISGGLTWEL